MCEHKTVTLHTANPPHRTEFHYDSITSIYPRDYGASVRGHCYGSSYCHAVAESPADVTRIARDVWPDFSCPGAEPPVVALHWVYSAHSRDGVALSFNRIVAISEDGLQTNVKGFIQGIGAWCGDVQETELKIRIGCAKTGVPCCEAKKPEKKLWSGVAAVEEFARVCAQFHPYYRSGAPFHIETFHTDPQVAKLKERVAELEAEVANMKEAYDGRNKEVRKIVAAKNNAQERIAELEAERFELLDERGNLKSRLGGCRTRNTDLQSELNAALRNYDAYVVQAVAEKEALQARINAEVWAQTRSPEWQVETERADNAEAKCATLQSRLAARDLHGGMRVSRLSQSPRGHAVIRIAIPHSAIEVAISPNNGKLSVRIDDEPDGSDDAEAKGETPDA